MVVSLDSGMHIHILTKSCDGDIAFFSADPQQTRDKTPFGSLTSWMPHEKDGKNYYAFKNAGGQRRAKLVDEMNPLLWKQCDFTVKLTALKAAGKTAELAIRACHLKQE